MIAAPPSGSGQRMDGIRVFKAMGTTITANAPRAAEAEAEFRRLEAILTRFGESSVTRLNRDGHLTYPPAELVDAVHWAIEASELTEGLVTPLVGRSLEWHGYRESWRVDVSWHAPEGEPPVVPPIVGLRVSTCAIELPLGAALDLGGTAKTWAVERVAALLDAPPTIDRRPSRGRPPDILIDAGGDILFRSAGPTEIDLLGGRSECHIELPPGSWGVATSSLTSRAWHGAHHLIDPRTGRPAHGRWTQATVVGRSLRHAELATKLLLFGAPVPAALGVEQAWVVDRDGVVH